MQEKMEQILKEALVKYSDGSIGYWSLKPLLPIILGAMADYHQSQIKPELSGWINVKDKLPADYESLATNGWDYLVGHVFEKDGEYFCESESEMLENVTHHRKLSPPNTESSNPTLLADIKNDIEWNDDKVVDFVRFYIMKKLVPLELDRIAGRLTTEQMVVELQKSAEQIDCDWKDLIKSFKVDA